MDDLISRQAAIDAVMAEGRNVDSRYLESDRIIHESDAVEALAILPSAQPYTPTDTQTTTYMFGKWIEKEEDGYHGGGYTECSVCGQRYSWGGYFEANGFRYCPRCGHRMEVVE